MEYETQQTLFVGGVSDPVPDVEKWCRQQSAAPENSNPPRLLDDEQTPAAVARVANGDGPFEAVDNELEGYRDVAGTDADAQLPFFITACDYTLIGEELYAGSVYLSREPLLMGALKAQDAGKAILILMLVVGSILTLFGVSLPSLSTN